MLWFDTVRRWPVIILVWCSSAYELIPLGLHSWQSLKIGQVCSLLVSNLEEASERSLLLYFLYCWAKIMDLLFRTSHSSKGW